MDHVLQDAARPAVRLKPVLARAAIVAAILGTALTLLNQPGAVFGNRERFPFAGMVEQRFPLDQIDEAFARAADRSVLRAAIVP